MKKVLKYQFEIQDEVIIEMPDDAQLIKADMQDGIPTLWALVTPDSKTSKHVFRIWGTGHEIDMYVSREQHVSTFFDRWFVWHLFFTGKYN